MYKSGVIIFCALLLLIPFVAAEVNDTEEAKVAKAYACLTNSVNNKTASNIQLQEAIFSVLALGSNDRAVTKLNDEKKSSGNQTCWPKSSCSLKESAQVLLAYRVLGKSTGEIENYLLSKSGTTSDLTWYLEADINNHLAATCKVRYAGIEKTVSIGEDMKISGDLGGSCLSIVPSGYWMQISPSCIDKSFEVSCSQSFITTLLYTQGTAQTLFVSPNTHSSTAGGFTNETITAKCFKSSSTDCDYEGTLWAALALDDAGKDVSSYIPYLAAFAPDNEKYIPTAALYKLTHGQDYYTNLIQAQTNNQYWLASGSPYTKFYDTAFALLSLQNTAAPEVSNSKNYLLQQQGSNGCWENNIRSTAFILYAAWPNSHPGSTGPTDGTSVELCLNANPRYSCVSSYTLCADAGGSTLDQYFCSGSTHCCSVTPTESTCSQLNGKLCSSDQECNGDKVDSADGQCCIGKCEASVAPTLTECESNGGTCTSSCSSGESETPDSCSPSSNICCMESSSSTTTSSSSWTFWIIILIILIILVALGIVYRKNIQMIIFKRKPSSTSTPIVMNRPPYTPPSMRRPVQQYSRQPVQARRQPSQIDKDMEETLRKLREMSK